MAFFNMDPDISETARSDEELCAMAAGGDREAEEALVKRYNRLVRQITRPYFLAWGRQRRPDPGGDVGTHEAVREFDCSKEASFHTFAEVCIRNRVYSVLRAAARENTVRSTTRFPLKPLSLKAIPTQRSMAMMPRRILRI